MELHDRYRLTNNISNNWRRVMQFHNIDVVIIDDLIIYYASRTFTSIINYQHTRHA